MLSFSALGLDLLEMRCPVCKHTQQIATRSLSLNPTLTGCTHCKTVLVCRLTITEKPNNVLLTLVSTAVPENRGEADDQ